MNPQSKKTETYKVIKTLGEGTYGKAILVKSNLPGNTLYVMKTIPLSNMSEESKKKTFGEAKILQKLNHPNIIKFHEFFIIKSSSKKDTLHIIAEYADGGDLYEKISNQKKKNIYFTENQILDYFIQITLALNHMHTKHILHRDIKSQNIFLTKNGIVKLGDFGISKSLEETLGKAFTVIGTPYYLSPEIISNIPYSYKSDIWSLGVLMYEMSTFKMPFDASSITELASKIKKGDFNKIDNKNYSNDLKKLISDMLNVDPQKRPSTKEILALPIMRNRMKNFLEESGYDQDFTQSFIFAFKEEKKRVKKGIKIKISDKDKKSKDNTKNKNDNEKVKIKKLKSAKPTNQESNNSNKQNEKKEENISLEKTKPTIQLLDSIKPSIDSNFSNEDNLDESQNLQNFIKQGKKEILFKNDNSEEILLGNEEINKEIKKNDKDKNNDDIKSNEENDKEKVYLKKKELYDANKYLDIISSTINGLNINYDEDEEDLGETIYNDDYGNIDDIILK